MWEKTRKNLIFTFMLNLVVLISSCNQIDNIDGHSTITLSSSQAPFPKYTITPFIPTKTKSPTVTITPSQTSYPPSLQGTPIRYSNEPIRLESVNKAIQLSRWGNGVANHVEYSQDGKYLAVSSTLGVYLYETETYTLINTFNDFPEGTNDISISPNNKLLAIVIDNDNYGNVEIITIPEGNRAMLIEDKVGNVEFSPDSEKLAVEVCLSKPCTPATIKILDSSTMELIYSIEVDYPVQTMKFSPDGKLLGGEIGNRIMVWNLEEEKKIFEDLPKTLADSPSDIAFSANGQYFAVSSYHEIYLYSSESFELLRIIDGDVDVDGDIFCIEFSPDSSLIAAGSNQISLWDTASGILVDSFALSQGQYTDLSWSKDGKHLASAAYSDPRPIHNSASVWNVPESKEEMILDGFSSQMGSITWSPDGNLIATSTLGYNGIVQIRRISNGSIIYTFTENFPGAYVNNLAFSSILKSSSWNLDYFVFFDQISVEQTQTRWTFIYTPNALAVSPDGQYILTAERYADPKIIVRRVDSGKVIRIFEMGGLGFENCSYPKFGTSNINIYVLCGKQGSFIKMNIVDNTTEVLYKFTPITTRKFVLSPDEKSFIIVSPEKVFLVHENKEATILAIPVNLSTFTVGDWSPNGEIIALSSSTGEIFLFNAEDGTLVKWLFGHTADVFDLEFSPDGNLLASSSPDGTIRIWGIP